jgi:hypothetical protein
MTPQKLCDEFDSKFTRPFDLSKVCREYGILLRQIRFTGDIEAFTLRSIDGWEIAINSRIKRPARATVGFRQVYYVLGLRKSTFDSPPTEAESREAKEFAELCVPK